MAAEPERRRAADSAPEEVHPADRGESAPPGHPSSAEPPVEERRGALKMLVTAGCLAYAGALAVPAARFLAASGGEGASGARWLRVGRLADLPEGEPRRLQVAGDERDAFTLTRDEKLGSVWVTREGAGVRVLSATCPHLGCSVDLGADRKSFACPCHASRFGLAGDAESGPSPRGMDPLAARLVDGFVEVDFRRYRQGVGDRQEVAT